MAETHNTNIIKKLVGIVLLVPVVLLIVPFALALLVGLLVYGVSLTVIVWLVWCTKGVDTLVVYSDSPNWRDYMIESVLPRLHGRAVVLNWSDRRNWHFLSLPVVVFRYFGGDREYNPIVIVFRPFRLPKTFRFWRPFQERKHGNLSSLHELETQLYDYLNIGVNPKANGG